MLGYALGDVIGDDIDTYLLPIIAVVIGISLLPVLLEWRKAKRHPVPPAPDEVARAEAEELEEILNPED